MLKLLGDLVTGWFNHLGYFGIVLAMALESCLIPLPSEVVMPVAGASITAAVATHVTAHFSLIGVSLAGAIGCVLGSAVAYWLGSIGGRPLIMKYGRYILVSRHDFDLADRWFLKYGDGITFFSRLLPVVRTYISLPAGISGMNFARFLGFTFLGSLPWTFALAFAGEQLGNHYTSIGKVLNSFSYLIVAAIVVLVGLYIYRHVRQERAYDQQMGTKTTGGDDEPTMKSRSVRH